MYQRCKQSLLPNPFFRPADATKYFLPKPQVYLFCERAYQITFNLLLVIAYVVIKNGSISLFRFIFIENKTLIHASLSPWFLITYSRNRNDGNHEGQFLQLKQHLIFPSLSVVVEYCMMRFITPNVLHLIHFIHEVWHFCCWMTWHRLKCFQKYYMRISYETLLSISMAMTLS